MRTDKAFALLMIGMSACAAPALAQQTQRERAAEWERQHREIKAEREREARYERERAVREAQPDAKRDVKVDYVREPNGTITRIETTRDGTRVIVTDRQTGQRREAYTSRADQHREQVDYAVRNGAERMSNVDGANERARQAAAREAAEQREQERAERSQRAQRNAP